MNLSIIILSYNTKEVTDECLKRLQLSAISCQKKLKNKVQVIVLDNASTDDSVSMIHSRHKWVELIESKENTGFSKGNNIAFKKAKHELVLFLNSDAYVEEDTLERSIKFFENPQCDVLGPRLVFANGHYQPSAGYLPNPLNVITWIWGVSKLPFVNQIVKPFHPTGRNFFDADFPTRVGWVMGAFLMIKKELFERVGGFDEDIFMYLDEVELCKRLSLNGYKIWYVPSIRAVHLHGASSDFDRTPAFLNEIRGMVFFLKKYYSGYYFWLKLVLADGLLTRAFVFRLLGKRDRVRAYLAGLKIL